MHLARIEVIEFSGLIVLIPINGGCYCYSIKFILVLLKIVQWAHSALNSWKKDKGTIFVENESNDYYFILELYFIND